MKTIVRYKDGATEEFDSDSISINQAGLLVAVKEGFILGMFVPENVASVFHPDGPPQVAIVKPQVVL